MPPLTAGCPALRPRVFGRFSPAVSLQTPSDERQRAFAADICYTYSVASNFMRWWFPLWFAFFGSNDTDTRMISHVVQICDVLWRGCSAGKCHDFASESCWREPDKEERLLSQNSLQSGLVGLVGLSLFMSFLVPEHSRVVKTRNMLSLLIPFPCCYSWWSFNSDQWPSKAIFWAWTIAR